MPQINPKQLELRRKIERIQIACWTDEGRHAPEAVACEQCSIELVELVKSELTATLKRYLADIEQLILTEVIEHENPLLSGYLTSARLLERNVLRAEQRQALSNLMRDGGES